MKKKYFFALSLVFSSLLLYGYTDGPLAKSQEKIEFSVSEAKNRFESKVTDFRQFTCFSSLSPNGSTTPCLNILTPLWEKAKQNSNAEATLIEIPIQTSLTCIARGKWYIPDYDTIEMNRITNQILLIAKRKTGVIQMFVVTLIPTFNYPIRQADFTENFSYLGGGNFSGTALIATVNGLLINAYEYQFGRKTKALDIIPQKSIKINQQSPKDRYATFRFFNYKQTMGNIPNPEQYLHQIDTAAYVENLGKIAVMSSVRGK